MLGLGCLFPVLLFIGGALFGGLLFGNHQGAIWGSLIGLALGCAVPLVMLRALVKARRKE